MRRGPQLAALLELLAGDPRAPREPDAVRAALAWEPRPPALDLRGALAGFVGVLIAIVAVAVGLHGKTVAVTYAADDALAPNGEKRSQADIIRFMETDVMPWARDTLGRLKGGADRVTCDTCHGAQARRAQWRMPAVAALPQPDVRDRGWEIYKTNIDAQMRNAIYGYLAGVGQPGEGRRTCAKSWCPACRGCSTVRRTISHNRTNTIARAARSAVIIAIRSSESRS